MGVRYAPLDRLTVDEVPCCQNGLEVRGKPLQGDLASVAAWRRARIDDGMEGVLAYDGDCARGFGEYLPAETAPFPIEAPGGVVLSCFHWAGTAPEAPEHLREERVMIERLLDRAAARFTGMAALGWDHPIHFPVSLLEGLGFREVERDGHIALMWRPFRPSDAPRLTSPQYRPRDHSARRRVAIDAAYSNRCPYSVDQAVRLRAAVADHPEQERIDLRLVAIDTRDDALRFSVSPWDWGWLYMNGDPVDLFGPAAVRLGDEIARHLSSSGPPSGRA